jgi:uncharacterized protein YdhG (YjbR/CyaY superfamily)
MKMRTDFTSIDHYISEADEKVRETLQQIREVIREAAPNTTECISYGMPAFRLKKVVVYFAAFKNHISLFPEPSGVEAFEEELHPYKHSKGTIQFQLNEPIPYDLIKRIVEFRMKEAMSQNDHR